MRPRVLRIPLVYKINREYEKARSVMKVALRRLQIMPQPDTREQQEEFERNQALVIYNLCELTIFLYGRNNLQSDLASALTLVQEYSQIQPENPKRLVLQYKMYQVSPVSMNEKIAILEKLRQEKHTQRWGYELALLYHQAGRDEDAVKECLDITAQFSGKYANKADSGEYSGNLCGYAGPSAAECSGRYAGHLPRRERGAAGAFAGAGS